jgi:flagellar motor switch protein FliG
MDEGVAQLPLTSRRKAAILAVSLGPSAAAELFKHLGEDTVEQLAIEMARLTDVSSEHAEQVHREVIDTAYAQGYMAEGGVKYAREVLERAVGRDRANEILDRIAVVIEETPFSFLRATPPEQIVNYLKSEHPQTVALVIANLPTPDLAAGVMQQLPSETQADVALRIAVMGTTPPDVVKEIAAVMASKLETVITKDYSVAGGIKSLAQILNQADRPTERNILEHLAATNPELAEEVRGLLFVFEDILKLDDRSIQLILKEIDSKILALALRGATENVKERILANMSQRGAEMLSEEMEYMPPQRRRDVEGAQSKVVATIRALEDAGTLYIQRGNEGGDDELIG